MKILAVSFITCFILCTIPAKAQQTIAFSAGGTQDSYQVQVITALLREALRRHDIKLKVDSNPSARSLVMSNSGHYDGELHRVYDFHNVSDGAYPNLVRIESQMMTIYLAVFSLDPTPVTQWDNLIGKKIAYQRGRKNAEQVLSTPQFVHNAAPKNNDLIAFRMLAEGRVDYVVSESFQGNRIIAAHPSLSKLQETHIYSYMHVKHAQLAETIGDTLEEMKRDGTYDAICNSIRQRMLYVHKNAPALP